MEIREIIEAMNNPQMRHAALVHFPVVLSIVGAVLALLSALWKGKNATLRWTAFGVFVALIGAALLAKDSGEDAENELKGPFAAAPAVSELIDEHEEMAEKVWIMAIGGAVFIGLSAIKKKGAQLTFAWLAVGVTGFTAGWVGLTAHHGGELVYGHGAGAPMNSNYVPSADLDEDHDDDAADVPSEAPSGSDNGGNAADGSVVDSRLVFFRANVKPVLEEFCIKCHNPTRKRRSGELDQTSIDALLQGGMSGPAVVPGEPEASWLIKAVRHEEDLSMPPKHDQLPDDVIANLEKWIRDGAVWEPLAPPPPREEGGNGDADAGS